MKPKQLRFRSRSFPTHVCFCFGLAVAAVAGFSQSSEAAQLTWNSAGPTDAWNTTDLNWDPGSVAWTNDSDAIFSTTPETVNVTQDVRFNSITFSTPGFTLLGPNLLLIDSTDNASSIRVSGSTGTATISAIIADNGATPGSLTKLGLGTLTLTGANTYTGQTILSNGTLKLDFTAGGAPVSNIISASSVLKLGGGRLQVVGALGGGAQTFASTSFTGANGGLNVISAAPTSGGPAPIINLGTLTGTQGAMVRFEGAAYNSGASSGTTTGGDTVAATAVYNVTTTAGTGGLIQNNTGITSSNAYATVGLYDWAAVSAGISGTQSGTIVGGSQIVGFYTTTGAFTAGSFGLNYDLTASSTMGANTTSTSSQSATYRINTAAAITITTGRALAENVVGGILITPNVGANNVTIVNQGGGNSQGFQASRQGNGATGITVWQNNTSGALIITAPYNNGSSSAATATYTQGGEGTVFLNGLNGYTGQTYLNGGTTVINTNNSIGAVATGAAVNLNGGTLLGNAVISLDNAGANNRAINLNGAGGTLAASAGNTLTVSGVVAGTADLRIGTDTIAGTGAGTANTTAVIGSGTVLLSGANTFTGTTRINSGSILSVTGSLLSTGAVSLNAGTLNGTGSVGAVTVTDLATNVVTNGNAGTNALTLSSLTFSGDGTINVKSGGSAGLIVTGALTTTPANGTVTITATNTSWSSGLNTLITYGSFNGNLSDYTLGAINGLSGRQSVSGLQNTGTSIAINIIGDVPVWSGANGSAWIQYAANAPLSGAPNFALKTLHTATDFWTGDNAEFNDTYDLGAGAVAANSNVVITGGAANVGGIAANSVIFNNSVIDYIVSSSDNTGITGGSVIKNGTKSVTISTNNSYNGSTTVNAGSLILSGNNTGTGAFNVSGGSLILSGSNTGATSLAISAGGVVQIGNGGTGGALNAAAAITNNGSLIFNQSDAVTQGVDFSTAAITGNGTLTQNGTGTLTLNAVNTYSGATNINSGTVSIATNTNISGPINLNGGTISTTGAITNTRVLTVLAGGGTINVLTTGQYFFATANTLLGSGALTVTGNGLLTVNTGNLRVGAANTYNGALTVNNGGIFEFGVANAVAAAATFNIGNQGEVAVNAAITSANNITVTGGTKSYLSFENTGTTLGVFSGTVLLNADVTIGLRDWYNYATSRSGIITGLISGTGGITLDPGTTAGGVLTLTAANTYTGATTIATGSSLQLGDGTTGRDGTIAGSATINNSGTLIYNRFGASTYGGAISGTGAVTKLGVGSQTLTGVNTYSGTTTINGGSLIIGSTGSITASAVTINTGGSLGGTGTLGGIVSAATGGNLDLRDTAVGTLTINGGLALNGGNSLYFDLGTSAGSNDKIALGSSATYAFSGATTSTININTLGLATGGTYDLITGATGINLANYTLNGTTIGGLSASLAVNGNTLQLILLSGPATAYWANNVDGTWAAGNFNTTATSGIPLTQAPDISTTVHFSTTTPVPASTATTLATAQGVAGIILESTQTGAVSIGGTGQLTIGAGGLTSNAGAGALTVNTTGGVLLGAAQTWTNSSSNATTIGSAITGANALTLAGTGGYVFSGANTYTGATNLNVGTLTAGSATAFSNGSAYTIASGTTLNLAGFNNSVGSLSGAGSVTLGTATLTTGALNASPTFTGVISGSGGLTKIGTGNLTLGGSNTYTGATTINGGILTAGSTDAFGSNSAVSLVSGTTLALGTFNNSIGSLNGAGNVNLGSATLTTGALNTASTFSGIASGAGGLTKTGTGTLTLSGANSYTGATAINNGTLLVTGSLAATPVTIASGATLAGTGSIAGLVTASSGSNINLQNGAISTLTLTGGLTVNGGSTLRFDLGTTAGSVDKIAMTGGTYTFVGPSTATVDLLALGTAVAGSYDIITGATGINFSNYQLASTTVGGQTASLSSVGGNLSVNLVTGSGPANAYWKGTTDSTWATGNFATDATGATPISTAPDGATTVHFSTTTPTTAPTATTLTGAQTIAGLVIENSQTGAVGIGGASALTIGAAGIVSNTNSGALNITTTGLVLGSIQTWTNNSANAISVSSVISGSGTGVNLTGTGTGGFTFTGANTYTAGTTISGTTLRLSDAGSLLSTGALTLSTTGQLDISGITASGTSIGTLSGVTGTSIVLGAKSLTITQAADNTFAGVVSGTGSLVKQGASVLTLTGASTYTGTTTISAGTLQLGNGTTGNDGTIAASSGIINNATLTYNRFGASTYAGTISGTGAVTKLGAGAQTLTGNLNYTGATTLSAGTLILSGSNAGLTGAFTMATGTTLQLVANVGNTTASVSNVFGGPHSTLNFAPTTGTNSTTIQLRSDSDVEFANTSAFGGGANWTGNFDVNNATAGTNHVLTFANSGFATNNTTLNVTGGNGYSLRLGDVTNANSGTLTLNATTANLSIGAIGASGAASSITVNGTGNTTIRGGITQTGTLTKSGTGALTLQGARTSTAGVNLTAGTLNIANAGALGTGLFAITGGTIDNTSGAALTLTTNNAQSWGGDFTFTGTNDLNLGTGAVSLTGNRTVTTTASNLTAGGVVSGAFGITKAGAGTLTLGGVNTYTGATTVSAGTLAAGSTSAFGSGSAVTVASGATLALNNFSNSIGSLAGAGNVTLGSATLTNGAQNTSTTFSGLVSGTGGLIKTGTGTLTLSGANTYSGATTVSGGNLYISGSLATSGVTVNTGATLSGFGTINGGVTVNSGGILSNANLTAPAADYQLNVGSLAFGANTTANLFVEGSPTTPGVAAIASSGAISAANPVAVTVTRNGSTNWGFGNYNLITAGSGSISAASFNLGTVTGLGGRQVASLAVSGSNLQLSITGDSLVWTGNAASSPGVWTTVGSDDGNTVALTNWRGLTNTTKNLQFIANDAVTFDDTAVNTAVTITGNVNPNSTVFNNTTKDYTLSGTGSITGSGTLTKNGTGTLTINTVNSYTGVTTINAGKIIADSTAALGTGAVIINNGGTLSARGTIGATTLNNGGSLGNMTSGSPLGLASLTLSGSNTISLLLNGGADLTTPGLAITGNLVTPNTGTGETVINVAFNTTTLTSGTQYNLITFGGTFTGGVGDFSLGTVTGLGPAEQLVLGATANAIVGIISGGELTWTGAKDGTWTADASPTPVGAANWDTGGTPKNFTGLEIVNFTDSSAVTTVTINAADVTPAAVHFNNSTNNYTLTGTHGITGPAQLTKAGTGSLTINNANSFTGGSFINGGTVIANNNSALGTALVTVDNTAGQTSILQINTGITLGNSVTLVSGGSLTGLGGITGNLSNSGTVAPGIGSGTTGILSIGGNYVQTSTGLLQIDVSSTASDALDINGSATLAGTLNVVVQSGVAVGDQYHFLSAGSITGDFDQVTSSSSAYRIREILTATDGYLLIAPNSYTQVALTPNQVEVATALDNWIGIETGDIGLVTGVLDSLTGDQYGAAFDQISPAFHSGALTLASNLSQATAGSLFQSLSARSMNSVDYSDPYAGDYLWDIWGQASGYFSDGGMSLIPGEDFKSGTYLVGANRNLTHNTSIGVFGGYGDGTGDFADSSSIDLERQFVGGYLTYVNGGFYANAAVGGGNVDYDSKRRIQFGGLDRTATGTTSGEELFAVIGGGYDFKFGDFTVGPQASLQRSSVKLDGFNETGADSLDLGLDDTEYTSLRSQVGGRMTYTLQTESSLAIVPFVQTFWQHEYEDSQDDIRSTLDGGAGPEFGYTATQGDQDSFVFGAGLSFDVGETFQAVFSYNRDSGNGGSDTMSATANFKF